MTDLHSLAKAARDKANLISSSSPNVKSAALAQCDVADYLANKLEPVTPPPPPPPPPPPSGTLQLRNTYTNPHSGQSYSASWNEIKALLPNLAQGIMNPLDVSVVKNTGTRGQICLIYGGITESSFAQYAVPAWQTGLVRAFVTVDEPGTDSASISHCKTMAGWVKKYCTGNNADGHPVKTMVTAYDSSMLQALINAGVADEYAWDNYPSRTGWDFASWQKGITVLDSAGVPYVVVLGVFNNPPNYPLCSNAQLQQYIAKAKATKAYGISVYTYGHEGGNADEIKNHADIMATLTTI